MERSMRLVSAAFLLVLLFAATEMGPMGVEGRKPFKGKSVVSGKKKCEAPSSKFKGICFLTNKCVNACKSEGLNGGQCRGFLRQCICKNNC